MRGNGRYLGLLPTALYGPRQASQGLDGDLDSAVDTTLQIDCTRTGGHVANALGKDRVSQNRGGAGAITNRIASALSGLSDHLSAEILASDP